MKSPRNRRHPLSFRRSGEAGETTFGILIALAIGSLIVMGFISFWLSGRTASEKVVEATQKQTAGLTLLNRIADDVSEAGGVVYADNRELVLENRETVGGVENITRTRYFVNGSDQLILERATGPASSFPPGSTNWGATSDQQILATGIMDAVHGAQGDGIKSVFRYVDRRGNTIADLPRDNLTGAGEIARIDIAYASRSGKAGGSQQLQTSAVVASAITGDKEPVVPACPIFRFTQGDPFPEFAWEPTGQTTHYNLYRDGTLIERINFTAGAETMTTRDAAVVRTRSNYYVLTAVGPGGESGVSASNPAPGVCQGQTWYPRILPPTVTAQVRPVTNESWDWEDPAVAGGRTGSIMEMTWPAVSGNPKGYQVYRRSLNPQTFAPTSGWTMVAEPGPTATVSYNEAIANDTAWEWRVVSLGPMPEASVPSNEIPGLAHTQRPGRTDARPYSRGINLVEWSGEPGPTATQIAVYRRDVTPGCNLGVDKQWRRVAVIPKTTRIWYDTSVPASTLVEYRVGAYNVGPRGNPSQRTVQYASMWTPQDDALQWPANPKTIATGSLSTNVNDLRPIPDQSMGGPDRPGFNSVTWEVTPLGCAGTTDYFEVQQFGSSATMANGSPDRPIASQRVPGGSSTTWADPRQYPRASRAWYMTVAWNATGPSPNWDPGTGTPCAERGTTARSGEAAGCADPAFQVVNNFNDRGAGTADDDPALSISHTTGQSGWVRDIPPADCETVLDQGYDDHFDVANQPLGSDTHGSYSYPAQSVGTYVAYENYGYAGDVDGDGRFNEYPDDYVAVSQNNVVVTRVGTEYACELHNYFLNINYGSNTVDNGPAGNYCGTWFNCLWFATAQIEIRNAAFVSRYAATTPFFQSSTAPLTRASGGNWEGTSQTYRIGSQDDTWDGMYTLGNNGRPTVRTQCNPGGCISTNQTYPPQPNTDVDAPVFRVYGSEGPDSRRTAAMRQSGEENPAYVGRNTITWAPARNATGYIVYAYPNARSERDVVNQVGTPVLNLPVAAGQTSGGNCVTAGIPEQRNFCFQDTGVNALPGAKTIYKVIATNGATTAGNDAPGVASYQAPQDSAVRLVEITPPAADNPQARLGWNARAGDEAETTAANRFCQFQADPRDNCTYRITNYEVDNASPVRNKLQLLEEVGNFPAPIPDALVTPIGGVQNGFYMRVCNYGGCADAGPRVYQATACAFGPAPRGNVWDQENESNRWEGDGAREENRVVGHLTFAWQPSCGNDGRGIDHYEWGRVPVAGTDPHNRVWPTNFNPNAPTSANTVTVAAGPAPTTGPIPSTPGATYTYYVYAIGKNGTRTLMEEGQTGGGVRMLASPAHPAFMQTGKVCQQNAPAPGWRTVFQASLFGRSAGRDVNISRLQTGWYATGIQRTVWNGAGDGEIRDYLVDSRDSVRYESTEPDVQDPRIWFGLDASTAAERGNSSRGPYWNNASLTRTTAAALGTSGDLNRGTAGQTGSAASVPITTVFPDPTRYAGAVHLRAVPWVGNISGTDRDAQDLPVPGYAMLITHQTVIDPATSQADVGGPNKYTSPSYEIMNRSYRDGADGPEKPTTCYQATSLPAPDYSGWTLRSGNAWQGQFNGLRRISVPDSSATSRWNRSPANRFTDITPRY